MTSVWSHKSSLKTKSSFKTERTAVSPIYEFLQHGGPVMIPIVAASIVANAHVLERIWYWVLEGMRRDARLRAELLALTVDRRRAEGTKDRVATVLYAFIGSRDASAAASLAERNVRETKEPIPVLNILATIACSLGLFGTVVGAAVAFDALGLGRQRELAGALSASLNATVLGLSVYLPAYCASALSGIFSARLANRMEDGLNVVQARLRSHRVGEVVVTG